MRLESLSVSTNLRQKAPLIVRLGRHHFASLQLAPFTADAVCKIVRRAGREAGIEFSIHPHMLRHATGYKLANDGQDTRAIQHYLGHRNIQHTTRYTDLASDRFKDFWRD